VYDPPVRRLAFAVLLISCIAFLAAGCGGKKSQPQAVPVNDWANSVCADLLTWTTTLKSVSSSLKANPTMAGLQGGVTQMQDATKALSDSAKSLGKPDTQSGQEAKDAVSQLSTELSKDVDTVDAAVNKASGVSGTLTAMSTVSSTLVTMGQQVSATFGQLQKLDVKGELEKAFSQSASCKQLTGS
jgi:hypothetical protein